MMDMSSHARGVSTIIGAVILVVIVAVLAGAIFVFATEVDGPKNHTGEVSITEFAQDSGSDVAAVRVAIENRGNADQFQIQSGSIEILMDSDGTVIEGESHVENTPSEDGYIQFKTDSPIRVTSVLSSGHEEMIDTYDPKLVSRPDGAALKGPPTKPFCEAYYASNAGSGTPSDPYEVSTVQELQCIAYDEAVDGHDSPREATHKITDPIDATATQDWEWSENDAASSWSFIDSETTGFYPIGSESNAFTGTLDGNGRTIRGLYIDQQGEDNVGLFGYASSARLHDITIVNAEVYGGETVGVLAGRGCDVIYNITISGHTHVEGDTKEVGGMIGKIGDQTVGAPDMRSLSVDVSGGSTIVGAEQVGGVFGNIGAHNHVQNVRFSGGTVIAGYSAGGIAGVYGPLFLGGTGHENGSRPTYENVTVEDAHIRGVIGTGDYSEYEFDDSDFSSERAANRRGGLVGGIIGSHKETSTLKSATVRDTTIEGERWVGGAVGWAGAEQSIKFENDASISDVDLQNITVIGHGPRNSTQAERWDSETTEHHGAGGVIGWFANGQMTNVSGSNIHVKANAGTDHGGILGRVGTDAEVDIDGTISGQIEDNGDDYDRIDTENVGTCVGRGSSVSCDFTGP